MSKKKGHANRAKSDDKTTDDTATEVQIRDEHGHLTYDGMCHVINSGGSVLYQDRNISRIDDLPDAAELAEGNEAMEEQVLRSLDEQEERIKRQRDRLQHSAQARKSGKAIHPVTGAAVAKTQTYHGKGQMTGGGESLHDDKTTMESGEASDTGASPTAAQAILSRVRGKTR